MMFDWDKDFEEVTTTRRIEPVGEVVAVSPNRGRIRRALLRMGAPLAVVGAIWAGSVAAPGASGVAMGAFGLGTLGLSAPMPADLLVYGQQQYDNFRASIAGFSDGELLSFATITLSSYNDPRMPLRDWSHDALVLTHLEIESRGLARPFAALEFDERRAALATTARGI